MSIAALLLAGGESRRMGSPKALIDFKGRPLWRHQLETLQALQPAELFISVPRDLDFSCAEAAILRDKKTGLGPLAGFQAAHEIMSAAWLIVLAVDMPAMTSSYLARLRDEAQAGGVGRVPEMDGYYLGLAAVYPRAFLARAETYLQDEDRSLQRFVRDGMKEGLLAPRPVLEKERPSFLNVNEPAARAAATASRPA